MKITLAALKKIIAEGTFEEGMRHVNEAAMADLYSLLQGQGHELSVRLRKAAKINDPRLKTVNDQAQELVQILHALMNANSLSESTTRKKNAMTAVANVLRDSNAAKHILREQAKKNPRVLRALAAAQRLNKSLQQFSSKK